MKLFTYIPRFLTNKFLLAGASFLVWILFFDRNDVFTQMERRKELRSLQESKEYYTTQIEKERKTSEELKSNPSTIEKYAREKYLMKRDNEDLFLVEPLEKHSKNIQ